MRYFIALCFAVLLVSMYESATTEMPSGYEVEQPICMKPVSLDFKQLKDLNGYIVPAIALQPAKDQLEAAHEQINWYFCGYSLADRINAGSNLHLFNLYRSLKVTGYFLKYSKARIS